MPLSSTARTAYFVLDFFKSFLYSSSLGKSANKSRYLKPLRPAQTHVVTQYGCSKMTSNRFLPGSGMSTCHNKKSIREEKSVVEN